MARARPVPGIDPDRRLRPNARRILRVRIAEVYSFDGVIADPARVRELHDMRIALKRLRYLLEIFDIAFAADLEPLVERIRALQDLVGDIHDRDVQIPQLEAHLRWLRERDGESARRLVRAGGDGAAPDPDEFAARLAAERRADEAPGIHALLARRRAERDELHTRFLEEWRRLKRERFRTALERAIAS